MRNDLGVERLAKLEESLRGPFPTSNLPLRARTSHEHDDAALGLPLGAVAWPRCGHALVEAYTRGDASPVDLARKALASARSFASRTPSMTPFLHYDDAGSRRDAEASLARYRSKSARGPLDGVPIIVKEETPIEGFPVRVGTSIRPNTPAAHDATIVKRLRDAGAIVLGQSPMTEFGMSPLGINPHRNMPRNPHNTGHLAGGSSTGSAVAVAEGICPIAIAADGGGSIRIPACFNGVFGIKPTWGRVSRAGDAFDGTMNHIGPIGASTADLATFLEACAGYDPEDPDTHHTPDIEPGSLTRALGRGVKGLRIGVLESELAEADSQVADACRTALAALEKEGAILVRANISLARYAASVGYLIIGTEELTSTRDDRLRHFDQLGYDLQIGFTALSTFGSYDLGDALRLRTGLRAQVAKLLEEVDLIAMPTTATGAPYATDDEARGGFLDPKALDAACRFAFLGNLTGLPAGTSPVGIDRHGVPLGLQLVGDAFDEATVLSAMAHLERIGAATVRRPATSIDLLEATP
ncbi:MAG: amidase [Polyangiaceae bacterium]